jgi:hypothetical protein
VLFNTRYTDAAIQQLRADGFDVRDEDVASLSPLPSPRTSLHLELHVQDVVLHAYVR